MTRVFLIPFYQVCTLTLSKGAANHYGWEPQLPQAEEKPSIMSKINVYYAEDDQPIGPEDLRPGFYSSEDFTSKLIEYLSDRPQNEGTSSKPFFAYLAYSAPHWPLQAPDEDIRDYRGVYDDGPEVLRQRRLAKLKRLGLIPDYTIPHDVIAVGGEKLSRDWDILSAEDKRFSARTMECYAGMVQNMDKQIGRLLDYLTDTGELENTVVLFMSDNGAEGLLLEAIPLIKGDVHEHIAKYYDNSLDNLGKMNSFIWYGPHWASAATAPSRLFKLFTTEGGVRVPLILNYPPLAAIQGTIDHSFSTVMDIMPTLLDLAGIPHPGAIYKGREIVPMRGKSWVQYLQGQKKQIHDDDFVMGWELYGRQAIRQGDYKAVYIPKPYGPEKWQLYNLKHDPGETNDLGELMPQVLKGLLLKWDQYAMEVGMITGGNPSYVEANDKIGRQRSIG